MSEEEDETPGLGQVTRSGRTIRPPARFEADRGTFLQRVPGQSQEFLNSDGIRLAGGLPLVEEENEREAGGAEEAIAAVEEETVPGGAALVAAGTEEEENVGVEGGQDQERQVARRVEGEGGEVLPNRGNAHHVGEGREEEEQQEENINVVEDDERLPLAAFLDPVIPIALPAHPSQDIGEGFNAIDRLSPWQCFLTTFGAMEEVPHQHKHMWAWAWSTVLERIQTARTEEETTRSLKWFLFLSQALLRTPREGGEAGRGFVAKRFNCLAERKWGELVKLWEEDVQQVRGRQPREQGTQIEEEDKLRRKVISLLGTGNVSKAVSLITSHGVADINSPNTRRQLEEKHPPRGRQLPASVIKQSPVSHLKRAEISNAGPEKKEGDKSRCRWV